MSTTTEPKAFSLECMDCDGGSSFKNREEAEAAGWIDIEEDDGGSWNYLGVCPGCQLSQARSDAHQFAVAVWAAHNPAEPEYQKSKWAAELRDANKVLAQLVEIGRGIFEAMRNVEKQERTKGNETQGAAQR